MLLQEMDGLNVNIPELTRLKQYHIDASRLINRFNSILVNAHEREDQQIIVDELNCILKEGATLTIQGLAVAMHTVIVISQNICLKSPLLSCLCN